MTNIETISVKELNKIMKTNPALYQDLLLGKSINIQNNAMKPLANTGHQAGTSGTQTSGTHSGIQKKTWNDFTFAQLKKMQKLDPEFFDRLFEAERERIRKKYNL